MGTTLTEETSTDKNPADSEPFDGAPYPFAIILGATTTLLFLSTVRCLWLLITV